ncbi:hypothetical protein BDC45DRAFT_311256 [Circinella umbellata]|nr:hypothetical protein BDC45DRAFT_311256 [Circinella umbellata]
MAITLKFSLLAILTRFLLLSLNMVELAIRTTVDIAPHLASNPGAVPTTSQFLFGESSGTQSDLYMLYASSISQTISAMNPHEQRPVILGIALKPGQDMKQQRQVFDQVIDKVMANPVW